MTIQETRRSRQDPEDPQSILPWQHFADQDSRHVPGYLTERGDDLAGVDFTVDTPQYTSPEFHALEREELWSRVWQMACRANDVSQVGDFVEYEIAGRSILVVRDTPTTIRAFRNSCRHRGTAVATGCGNRRCFVCPFHGWSYALDGTLTRIGAQWDFPHLPAEDQALVACQAEVFDGWVFVNLDLDARPLSDHLGETVARHLAVRPSERMWKSWHYGIVVQSNWKIAAEAFFETYHAARTHPELDPFAGDLNSQYDSFGLHHRLIAAVGTPSVLARGEYTEDEILGATFALGSFGGRAEDQAPSEVQLPPDMSARRFMAEMTRAVWGAQGVDLAEVSDAELVDAVLYFVFPNFMTFRSPAGHQAYRFRPNGDDHTTAIFEVLSLVPVAAGADLPPDTPLQMLAPGETFRDHMGGLGHLLDQDVRNCALIQKGMQGLDRIYLGQAQEKLIAAFHRNLETQLRA